MTSDPLSDPLRLLAEDRFLRGLARGLLRDAQTADDVVQDAWLAAMARPPRAAGALGSWLRTVVRNLVANRRVAEAARLRREQAVARPESVPSEEAVRAREALRREVVEHVLALPEPYRAAVLLRYFEDLPPRAIAARLDVPRTTVRTRLHRALEMLRVWLDAERSGDRRAWCLLLIPLARPRLAGAAAVVGGGTVLVGSVVMKKVFVGVLVALLLLCGGGLVWVLDVGGARGAATAQAAPVAATGSMTPSAPPAAADPSLRRAEIASTEPADASAQRTGQLMFADGHPAANVPWWFEPGRRLPSKDGFLDDRGPHAAMRAHPAPGDAQRTGVDGGFPLPGSGGADFRPGAGALWCEPTTGVRVGFQVDPSVLPSGEPLVLRLPGLADFQATCAGAGREDRWALLMYPAGQEEDGEWNFGHGFVRLLDAPGGGRLAVELDAHFLRHLSGPSPAVVRVPAGLPYHVAVEAASFVVITAGGVHRAPAQVQFETGTPLFTLPIEVFERDGRTPALAGGRVLVSPRDETGANTFPLVGGRATVGWCAWPEGTLCDLRVLMADGELFADTLRVWGRSAQPGRQFVRGRGQPPQRVQFPAGPASPVNAAVVVEAHDGKPLRLFRGEQFSFFFPSQAGAFVAGPQGIGLVAVAPNWRSLWVLLPDGQVGEATNDGRALVVGSWTAMQPLGAFDLAAAFRARHVAWVCATFEVEVVTSSGARSWQLADSLQLESGDEDEAIPVWRKCTPTGWRGRVRLQSRSFNDILTPVR